MFEKKGTSGTICHRKAKSQQNMEIQKHLAGDGIQLTIYWE